MPPAPSNANRNADLLQELANYLAAGLNMTVGQSIFIDELPEAGLGGVPSNPDRLYIIDNVGPPPDQYIDTETHLVDMWTSSSSSINAKELLHRAYDILERKGNYALTNWYIYFSYANGTVRNESRGREGNRLYSQSWLIICRNLNNIS